MECLCLKGHSVFHDQSFLPLVSTSREGLTTAVTSDRGQQKSKADGAFYLLDRERRLISQHTSFSEVFTQLHELHLSADHWALPLPAVQSWLKQLPALLPLFWIHCVD